MPSKSDRSDTAAQTTANKSGPRFASLWASLVYALATLTLAYPAIAGAFLLNPRSDQYKAGYAIREFAAEHLRSGRGFPQWNPFIMGGLPYVAAMHGDIFYPTFLLRMIMPTDMAMTWEFPIHLFLCGLFTFWFLRSWNVGFWGSLVGGLAYLLGGSIAGYAGPGHDGKLFVSTMLPLGLFFLTRGIRDGRLWAWGAFAITVGLALLSPHPQLFQYFLLVCGAFSLYVAFATHPGQGRLPRATAVKRLAAAAGGVVLGMLIGAIQYWPAVFEYKSWSPRAGGHDYATATSYSFPIEEIINSYWPQFSGILDAYWGRNFIHFHSDFFGVIVLILVGAAFGASTTGVKSFRRFWVATGLVALLWAFGGYTPFFRLILALVPGTVYFRAPSTIIYVTAFAVSVLAALGMDRLLERRVSPTYAIGWVIFAFAFAVLMSIGGYRALSTSLISTFSDQGRAGILDYLSQMANANTGAAIAGVWRSFFVVIIGAGLIWAFLTNRIPAKGTAIALLVVLVIDLWSVERLYWIFSPRASVLYATDPAIDAIKADMKKSGTWSRVWTEALSAGVQGRDPAFVGDALMSHDLRMVGNYHGNELRMYDQLMANANLSPTPELQIFGPPFWRHENVGYLYTGADDSTAKILASQLRLGAPLTRLAGPVRNAAGSMVYAYKLPVDNRAAWVTTAMVKAPEEQALGTVLDERFDPARVAIIDTSAKDVQTPALGALPAPATTKANVTAAPDGSYDIVLDGPAPAGSALVVSDNYFPGWRATVDGKPAPVARTNFNLIGVPLPEGARNVQLRFVDPAYVKGKALTLIALVIALIILGAGFALDRRRSATA